MCNLCKGNTFGLREKLDIGCEACNCDPMGKWEVPGESKKDNKIQRINCRLMHYVHR